MKKRATKSMSTLMTRLATAGSGLLICRSRWDTFQQRRLPIVAGLLSLWEPLRNVKKRPEIVVYDPETNRWEKLTDMLGARSATVAGVIGDEIVLATGTVGGSPLDTTWIGSWPEN